MATQVTLGSTATHAATGTALITSLQSRTPTFTSRSTRGQQIPNPNLRLTRLLVTLTHTLTTLTASATGMDTLTAMATASPTRVTVVTVTTAKYPHPANLRGPQTIGLSAQEPVYRPT